MIPEPIVIKSHNGRNVIVRSVTPDDAEAMLNYSANLAADTKYVSRETDESVTDLEVEKAFLEEVCNSDYSFMLVPEIYGEISGTCTINPVGITSRTRHRCILGITICSMYRRQGVGKQLIDYALSVAKDMGYEQCELEVYSSNEAAIALYKLMGFVTVGEIPNAVHYKDGTVDGSVRMIKLL